MALRPRAPVTAWGRAFEAAFEAGLALAVGVVVGAYLDRRLDTTPGFILAFMVLGFVVALRRLLAIRLPPMERKGKETPRSSDSGGDS